MAKKIIIDAYQYSASITGTDRMAYNLISQLQKLDSENNYLVICSNQSYIKNSLTKPNFKSIRPPNIVNNPFIKRCLNYAWRHLTPYYLKLKSPDVYISMHNMKLPPFRIAPKMVVFNLDLIPLVLDGYIGVLRTNKDKLNKEYKRVAELADTVISISNFSKNELIGKLGVEEEKIKVLELAADESFDNVTKENRISGLNNGSYLLTIGGSEPRKNVSTVIEAYQKLSQDVQQSIPLAIAGGEWHGRKILEDKDLNIVNLGYVEDSALPALYSNALAFIFASKYEGFGFALLEAMASGTPVISSKGTSLDEVGGKATLFFRPDDSDELATLIKKVLDSSSLRQKLISSGFKQNKKYSWESSGKKLYEILTF